MNHTSSASSPRTRIGIALSVITLFFGFLVWRTVSAQSALNIATVAGSSGGAGLVAEFQNARGIAAASATVIYVADAGNHVVRKVDVGANTVTIVAGKAGMAASNPAAANGDGGAAASALLNTPSDVAVDGAGNLYITDSGNHRIRRVSAAGATITTVAGSGTPGAGVGAPGALDGAVLNAPRGMTFDASGRLLIADTGNHRVVAISAIGTAGASMIVIAGNSAADASGDGGQAIVAGLSAPQDVAASGAIVYIADTGNHKIRKIDAAGTITTFAGTGLAGFNAEAGAPATVQLNAPAGVAVDAAGMLFIADTGNHRVRQSDAANLSTIAGKAGQGFSGEGTPATNFSLNTPIGISVASGQVLFMDSGNRRLRKVAGTVLSTVASDGSAGFAGDGGLATSAKLNGPLGVAVDAAGNYFIADTDNQVIRKVNAADKKISTIAGVAGAASANPADANGDGGAATSATLNKPAGLAVDSLGNIFVADTGNNRIRKIATDGKISTIAGTVGAGSPSLSGPSGVAVAGTTLYIADPGNHVVRAVSTSGGPVTIFAGASGVLGSTGDGGAPTAARLNRPSGVAVDAAGNLYIADTNNHRIRKVAGGAIASIVASGLPRSGSDGDGGAAVTARLNSPSAVALDSTGNLYIADRGNNRIRRVNAVDGKINTIIGNGDVGFGGDGGPATQASLSLANSIAVNAAGVFIADTGNNRIRLASGAPNTAPSLTNPGNQAVNEGQTLGFTLAAADPDGGQALNYTMSGAPAGATLDASTGAFSYTPDFNVVPNNAGATQVFNVTFAATDNGASPLSDSKAVTVTVANVNRAPAVDSGAIPTTIEATGPNGANLQLNGTATDPDGDAIASVLWTDSRPNQQPVTIASQLSATAPLGLGMHGLVLTVNDGKPNGAVSTAAKGVVVQDTTPPVFSNLPADITQTIATGASVNVSFTLPTAADLVSGNRAVTATPASGALFPLGVTTVTFSAADAAGNAATATFKVTVVCNGAGCSGGGMNFTIAAFAGAGSYGFGGDGAAAAAAAFKRPAGIAVDPAGNVYISDSESRVIRRVTPQGAIGAFAGTGAKGFAGDGASALAAKFNHPAGLAFDGPRNALYVADANNHRIRKIDLGNNTISTVAGNGIGALGANGVAVNTSLNYPMSVAVDAAGAIYIADTGNNRLCKVSGGQLSVLAGTGDAGASGDGGNAASAKLNHPLGLAVSSDGNAIYVADTGNNRVRKITGAAIAAFAGTGTAGFSGDGGAATAANLNTPAGVLLDAGGNVILTDAGNERIRKVSAADGKINTIAGTGNAGNAGDGGAAASASLDTPQGIAANSSGVLFFADAGNLRVRRLTMSGPQNNPPSPAAIANQSLNKNQVLDVALSATDADNDPVTFTVTPALSFVSIVGANPAGRTAVLRINPNGGNAGVYTVQVQAADDKSGMALTPAFTITVTDPNSPPPNRSPVAVANALPASLVAENGTTAMVSLNGSQSSDPDGDALSYSWTDNGQVIATMATASVPLAVGSHSIVLTVSDGKGGSNSTAAQSVTVTAPPSAELAIASISPTEGKRGQTVAVMVTGTGFTPQCVLTVNGGGVTVTIISITSLEIKANFAISSATASSTRNITVTNPGVTSVTKSATFTIRP